MNRLTTDAPKSNLQNMLNLFYIKNNETWVRGGGPGPEYEDVSLFAFTRQIVRDHAPDILLPDDDDSLSDIMPEWLFDGADTIEGLIALIYTAAWTYAELRARLAKYEDAEEQGRLVELPCKVGDAVFAVGERLIKKCDIDEVHVDKFGVEYLVSFICADDCDGCPFNSWHQDYSGEYSCNGEWGQAVIRAEDFGKTVFLSRKEAEAALEGGKHE